MKNQDQLDSVLNDALQEYRKAEPLAGLEQRVLVRLRLRQTDEPTRWWRWATAIAVASLAAVLICGLYLKLRRTSPESVPSAATLPARSASPAASAQGGQVLPSEEPERHAASVRRARHARGKARTAQQSVALNQPGLQEGAEKSMHVPFPAPTPMSQQEQRLIAFAQSHPDALSKAVNEDGGLSIPPIEIPKLGDLDNESRENP